MPQEGGTTAVALRGPLLHQDAMCRHHEFRQHLVQLAAAAAFAGDVEASNSFEREKKCSAFAAEEVFTPRGPRKVRTLGKNESEM